MIKKFQIFDQFHPLDPYGEENWDDRKYDVGNWVDIDSDHYGIIRSVGYNESGVEYGVYIIKKSNDAIRGFEVKKENEIKGRYLHPIIQNENKKDIDPYGEEIWDDITAGDMVVCVNIPVSNTVSMLKDRLKYTYDEKLRNAIKNSIDKIINIYSQIEIGKIYKVVEIDNNILSRKIKLDGLHYFYPENIFKKVTTSIPVERWGVHANHCCKEHGCKYGNQDCPVELGFIEQEYPCEVCSWMSQLGEPQLEHIAYLDDEYDPDETLELVGLPSGQYFTIKRRQHSKIQMLVNWSDRLQTYVFRDKDYNKILFLLDKND